MLPLPDVRGWNESWCRSKQGSRSLEEQQTARKRWGIDIVVDVAVVIDEGERQADRKEASSSSSTRGSERLSSLLVSTPPPDTHPSLSRMSSAFRDNLVSFH